MSSADSNVCGASPQLREERISPQHYRLILRQVETDEASRLWNWLPLPVELILKTAALFTKLDSGSYLRAADALHLACAFENGFAEVYSNDKHLLAAAGTFGVEVGNVIGER